MKFVGVHWNTIQVNSSDPRVLKKMIHNITFMVDTIIAKCLTLNLTKYTYIAMDSSPDREVMEFMNHNFLSKE